MDLTFTAEQEAFRAEARAWLAAHVPPEPLPSLDTAGGFEAHRAWERTMFEDRWSVVSWPAAYGGRDLGIFEWLIFEEEYYRARAPKRVSQNGIFLLGAHHARVRHGSQKARLLGADGVGRRDLVPGLVRARRRQRPGRYPLSAVRNGAGDGWLLSGQKTWASRGAFADWCFGIFRTDPEAERHRGLTYFLVADRLARRDRTAHSPDRRRDGLRRDLLRQRRGPRGPGAGRGGRGLVGRHGHGRLANAGSRLRSPARYTEAADRLVRLFDQRGGPAASADAVAQAHMDAEAYRLHTYWTATKVARGHAVGPEASCNKIFWSETDVAIHRAALDLLGPEAELLDAGGPGEWLDGYLFSLAGPIYAGTNEIQRNVVAERLLGLPRG